MGARILYCIYDMTTVFCFFFFLFSFIFVFAFGSINEIDFGYMDGRDELYASMSTSIDGLDDDFVCT